MPEKMPPTIAQGDEILQYLTTILRAEEQGAQQRLKAAELLGKRLGLFADAARAEGAPPVQIISDIPPPAQQAAPAGDAGGGGGHADE